MAKRQIRPCGETVVASRVYRKSIIIVDPVSSGSLLAPAFDDRGILPISARSDLQLSPRQAASYRRTDFQNDLPAGLQYDLGSGDFASALSAARAIATQFGPPLVGIIPGAESGVVYSEKISASLGVPFMNDPRGIKSRRFKWPMHQELAKKGIRIMPQFLTARPEDAIDWIRRKLGGWRTVGKVVVKTGMSHGSTQVEICKNDEEVASAILKLLSERTAFGHRNQKVIIQPFIPGREFAVNGAALRHPDGRLRVRFTDVWEYIKPKPPLYGHDVLLDWSEIPAGVLETHLLVLDGLLVNISPFHGEYKVTPDGIVYLIENAIRMYGAGNPAIAGASTDYGQVEATVDLYDDPEHFFAMAGKPYIKTHHSTVCSINVPASDHPLYASFDALDPFEAKLKANGHYFKIIRFMKENDALDASSDLLSTLAQIEIRIPVEEERAIEKGEAYLEEIQKMQDAGSLWRR